MGRDLLAVDWDATPIGPPERWPRALGNIVQVMLGSRFAMWMAWGPELTFFCNDAYRRDTLGTKYPWALGRPSSEVWAEVWGAAGSRIESVMRNGEATWDEALLLFLERSGFREETYHTFSYSPLTGDDGRVEGMLCVVSEDTTRVLSERQLATLRDLGAGISAARDEREVLAAAGHALDGDRRTLPFTLVYLFGEDGAARLAAHSRDAWAPHADTWPQTDHAAVVDEIDALDPPWGAWDEPPVAALTVPLGTIGFFVAGLNRYRVLDEDYRGFVELVAGQITAGLSNARAREEERFRSERLVELDEAKTAFFTNVSHELRTPLTLLLGPAEDALADPTDSLDGEQRVRVERIQRNAQRLLKLVNTLLDFSRLQSGRVNAAYTPIDLARYTAELVSMFDSATERGGLELEIDTPPLPDPVYVDTEMWAKIVMNLVSNALKFTFTGGITVRLYASEHHVELAVADTGIGIDLGDQERLFERFHRVIGVRSRSHEGTGVGLALVAELAELHGGTAAVESTLGEGSTFTVAIPFGAAHLPADQVTSQPAVPTSDAGRYAEGFVAEAMRWLDPSGSASDGHAAAPASERPRVLVVDDNADMRSYIASLLDARYAVQTAPDGAVALELARKAPPELIVTDVMMPNLDGFGLLAGLQADAATTGIPVIMVSARAGEQGTIEGLEAGADDYLIKPFAARELLARVHANIELDRARRTRDALRRSGDLLDQAQRLARVGSWEIDLATNEMTASAEYLHQVDMTIEELRAGGFDLAIQRVHPDDLEQVLAAIEAGRVTGSFEVDCRFVTPARGTRIHHARGEVELGDDGEPRILRGSVQDVTDQRLAEEAVVEAHAEREAADRERRIADELQRSLMPERSFDAEQLEIGAYYQAGVEGTQVGGDWYDVIDLGAGRTGLVLGDVIGRGVRAAAVMGQLRTAVRAYAQLELSPADVLELLDDVVGQLGAEQIVTCLFAVFDPRECTLSYANAGQLPPLLATPGQPARRLDASAGPPLGTGAQLFTEATAVLGAGDLLALYTDGLVERRDRVIDAGIDRLGATLAALEGEIGGLPDALVHALVPEGSDDDVALLVARVLAAPPETSATLALGSELNEIRRARGFTTETLIAWGLSERLRDDALLIAGELVTNAILHGRAPVELRLRRNPDHLRIEADDRAAAIPRKLRPTPEDDHGRGLQLTAAVAHRWGTRPLRDGKSVWCELTLARY